MNSFSSVIRQKGESQNGGNKETKHAKFSDKPTDWHTYIWVSGGKKCSFLGKFGALCFPVTSVLVTSPFFLIIDVFKLSKTKEETKSSLEYSSKA